MTAQIGVDKLDKKIKKIEIYLFLHFYRRLVRWIAFFILVLNDINPQFSVKRTRIRNFRMEIRKPVESDIRLKNY